MRGSAAPARASATSDQMRCDLTMADQSYHAIWRLHCAACGVQGDLHRHHLVPRVHGGASLPSVMLCIPCHGLVHGRVFPADHRHLTIAGLQRAKARGVKLGGPNLRHGFAQEQAKRGNDAQVRRSKARAESVRPFIEDAMLAGAVTLAQIAVVLTERGVPSPSGHLRWHPSQVWRIVRASPP